jgi:hypothetical protein
MTDPGSAWRAQNTPPDRGGPDPIGCCITVIVLAVVVLFIVMLALI